MADFGDPSTWEMNVDQFIDSGLPKEKPQELLDLQEQNRKQRLLQSLQKIGPRLEDSSLDFINRENFAEAGGVFGNTAEKREKTLKDIKKYFDKQIQKGPVSMSDMEKKFPKQARVTITKSLAENANKLTRVTPLQTKFKNKVSKIINDVYDNKKPLINASPRRIFKELYGREFKIDKDNTGVIKKIIQSDLDLSNKYNELTPKITNTSTRVGAGNKLFESVKVKDFDEVFSESIKKRGVTRAGTVEEFILRDLKRHIDQGGKKFEFTKNNTFDKGFKGLKIKDLKKGDIIDFNSIKKDDPRFKEYKQVFKDIKKLKLTPYVNPITKEETTLMEGLQKATNIQAPLHIQHNKGVANDPLKNLSIQTFKANIGAKMVETPEQAKKLGVQTTVPGSKKVVGPKLSFEDQVNRLTKFSDRMIKGAGTRELKTPKQTLFKPGMQPDGRLVDLPGGNEKGFLGGEKLAKATGQKLLQALKVLGQPSIAAGFGVDELRKGNIKTAGSMLLAPEFVGSFAPAGKGILSTIGRVAANPFGKAVRAFTPVGLATIGAGMGKDVYDEYKRREALTDEERLQEDIERDRLADEGMIGAAEGGRIGFADGPNDPSRRKFIKLMGILSLLPYGIGKMIKPAAKVAETAAPVVAEGVKLGFDKFMMLVDKIKKLGKQTDGVTQTEREVGYVYRGKDGNEYELVEDLTTGNVRVTKDKPGFISTADDTIETIEDRSTFVLRRNQADETTKGRKPTDEYDEMKEVPGPDGTFDDVDEISDLSVKEVLDEIN